MSEQPDLSPHRPSWIARRLDAIFGAKLEAAQVSEPGANWEKLAVEEVAECYEGGDLRGARQIALEANLSAPFIVDELSARLPRNAVPDIIALARQAHEILGEPYWPPRTMPELAADLYHYGDCAMAADLCTIQCIGASEFIAALRGRYDYSPAAAISVAIDSVGLGGESAGDISQRAKLVKILRQTEEKRAAEAYKHTAGGEADAAAKLVGLDKEAEQIRAAYEWSRPGETIERAPTAYGEMLVIASGYGGASLIEFEGIYPSGGRLLSREEFTSEHEALVAFESRIENLSGIAEQESQGSEVNNSVGGVRP